MKISVSFQFVKCKEPFLYIFLYFLEKKKIKKKKSIGQNLKARDGSKGSHFGQFQPFFTKLAMARKLFGSYKSINWGCSTFQKVKVIKNCAANEKFFLAFYIVRNSGKTENVRFYHTISTSYGHIFYLYINFQKTISLTPQFLFN